MLINIKTSKKNKDVVRELTGRFKFNSENIVSRIAFAYSISQDISLDPNKDMEDAQGKEYKDEVLFGRYRDYYIALVCQQYQLHKSDPDIAKYIKMHIDDGLKKMKKLFDSNPSFTGFDFLMDTIDHGISALEESEVEGPIIYGPVSRHMKVKEKPSFIDLLNIEVGKTLDTEEPIHFKLNDKSVHDNQHMAIAGASGTGKTQFALELLRQITEQSQQQVNFIFLDFKGLKGDDVKELDPFFDATNATFVDAPHDKFPINPLTFIDTIDQTNKTLGITKFVDIVNSYVNLGTVQVQVLKQAVRDAFDAKKGGEYPSFEEIYEAMMAINEKPNKMTSILQSLSELDMFVMDDSKDFLDQNFYFSLSADLPNDVRYTATYLIINFIYNTFMNMSNPPIEDDKVGMRYVFLIDEAHNVFGQKKAQALLDKILREIRSKGVSVVLLSQGINEFIQPEVDFSSNCETSFLLDIKDKSNVKMMNKFLGFTDKETKKMTKSMSNIEKGQAISNLKEYKRAELFDINQFWKNK